jgi:hypothetical protein
MDEIDEAAMRVIQGNWRQTPRDANWHIERS